MLVIMYLASQTTGFCPCWSACLRRGQEPPIWQGRRTWRGWATHWSPGSLTHSALAGVPGPWKGQVAPRSGSCSEGRASEALVWAQKADWAGPQVGCWPSWEFSMNPGPEKDSIMVIKMQLWSAYFWKYLLIYFLFYSVLITWFFSLWPPCVQ